MNSKNGDYIIDITGRYIPGRVNEDSTSDDEKKLSTKESNSDKKELELSRQLISQATPYTPLTDELLDKISIPAPLHQIMENEPFGKTSKFKDRLQNTQLCFEAIEGIAQNILVAESVDGSITAFGEAMGIISIAINTVLLPLLADLGKRHEQKQAIQKLEEFESYLDKLENGLNESQKQYNRLIGKLEGKPKQIATESRTLANEVLALIVKIKEIIGRVNYGYAALKKQICCPNSTLSFHKINACFATSKSAFITLMAAHPSWLTVYLCGSILFNTVEKYKNFAKDSDLSDEIDNLNAQIIILNTKINLYHMNNQRGLLMMCNINLRLKKQNKDISEKLKATKKQLSLSKTEHTKLSKEFKTYQRNPFAQLESVANIYNEHCLELSKIHTNLENSKQKIIDLESKIKGQRKEVSQYQAKLHHLLLKIESDNSIKEINKIDKIRDKIDDINLEIANNNALLTKAKEIKDSCLEEIEKLESIIEKIQITINGIIKPSSSNTLEEKPATPSITFFSKNEPTNLLKKNQAKKENLRQRKPSTGGQGGLKNP